MTEETAPPMYISPEEQLKRGDIKPALSAINIPNLIGTDEYRRIQDWWWVNGGFAPDDPSAHALKILEEVVELCYASGATTTMISQIIASEIRKAEERDEATGRHNPEAMQEEIGDVIVTVCSLVQHYPGYLDSKKSVRDVLTKLATRQWSPDASGVLRRPRPNDPVS